MLNKYLIVLLLITNYGLDGLGGENNIMISQGGVGMKTIKKSVKNIDRYKNVSTSPSAIKIQLKDTKMCQTKDVVVRNDDLFDFLIEEKLIKNLEDYIEYLIRSESKPIEINLSNFENVLGKRWCRGKSSLGKKYFNEHVSFEVPMTFRQLGIKSEEELLEKYFDFNYPKGSGSLKSEYYEKYTREPAFTALLIDLGYDVVWGDPFPNLNIYITPFISHFKQSNE
ncbi:MAG: hypothetical protein HW406_2036 [Candidatus Brocadiaceae bacterium]|nr:hypothetical protein [Candidatus Brocadiaceae bacterium]